MSLVFERWKEVVESPDMEGEVPEPKTSLFGRVFGVQEVKGGGGDTRHVEHARMGVFYVS